MADEGIWNLSNAFRQRRFFDIGDLTDQSSPIDQEPNIETRSPEQLDGSFINPLANLSADTPGLDALKAHLGSIPEEKDYPISKFQKIMGVIGAGLAAGDRNESLPVLMRATQAIKDEPYNQAMESWKNKLVGLEHAADAESRDFGRKIQLGSAQERYEKDAIELGIRQARNKDLASSESERNRLTGERNKILAEDKTAGQKQKAAELAERSKYHAGVLESLGVRAAAAMKNATNKASGQTQKGYSAGDYSIATKTALEQVLRANPDIKNHLTLDDTGKFYIPKPGLKGVDANYVKKFFDQVGSVRDQILSKRGFIQAPDTTSTDEFDNSDLATVPPPEDY